ncbi:hypothetical protein C8J57DRAFT_1478874, partial [Mycena rebaudengoi]
MKKTAAGAALDEQRRRTRHRARLPSLHKFRQIIHSPGNSGVVGCQHASSFCSLTSAESAHIVRFQADISKLRSTQILDRESSGSAPPIPPTPLAAPSNMPAPALTEEEIALAAVVKRVEASLRASQDNGARQRRKGNTDENSSGQNDTAAETTYCSYGRNLACTCGPLMHIQPIVEFGVIRDLLEFDEQAKAKAPPLMTDQIHMLESWEILKKTIPKFGDDMLDLGGANKIHNWVCAEIQEGVNGARRDDTSTLKHMIIDYLPPLPPMPTPAAGEPPVPPPVPIPPRGHKGCCGWNHVCTAELNCLHKITEKTPQTYTKIANGDIKVTGLMMPTFMYRDGQPYDSEDLDAGLLEGHTFCVAMKQIYQGPTAALQEGGYNRGKAGNTALNGITALTPHDIAYVAIQVRFVLSSVQTCSITDSKFNYSDFYWSVVDSLRREEGTEIIQCLNLNVFSTQ